MGMILFTLFLYVKSGFSNAFRPIAFGVACGEINGPASSFPYVYYSNPLDTTTFHRYCVSSCPTFDATGNSPVTMEVYSPEKTVTLYMKPKSKAHLVFCEQEELISFMTPSQFSIEYAYLHPLHKFRFIRITWGYCLYFPKM
jgi:hypothetical protein